MNMRLRFIGDRNILISAIVLIISVISIIDMLLASGHVQLILADGKAVPVESASLFSINEVLFLITAAWLGGMSFLFIILRSRDDSLPQTKNEIQITQESKTPPSFAANLLDGDEKTLFQIILDNDGTMQREIIAKTGFSEPKVSRLLDKVERKGLIIRQRDGMGNRIFLKK